MSRKWMAAALLVAWFGAVPKPAWTNDVTYFRRHFGVAANDQRPLPDGFTNEEALAWRQPLAPGHSTPCVWGDWIFLTTYDREKSQLATVALDRQTGRLQWRQPAPTTEIEPFHPVGSPAASTPACDGQRLYVFFGSYGLLCYNLKGNSLWNRPMGPFQQEFGAASSPVLVDGKVVLCEDHDITSYLIAVEQATGETAWKTERDGFTRGYSTPVVWDSLGQRQIVVAGSLQLAAYDINDGHKRWWFNGLSRILDTTPAIADGMLYVASRTPGGDKTDRISMERFAEALQQYDQDGDEKIAKKLSEGPVLTRFFRIDLDQDGKLDETEWGKHARVFELAQNSAVAILPGGQGDVTETHLQWMGDRGLPTVPSPLVYRGVLYMVKDGGIVTSLDASNGEILDQGRARGRGNYYASPVAGDGKIYLASERGVVTVLKHGRPWRILSSYDFNERIMATPVIADGKIYLRTENALYCFAQP